MSRIGIKPIVVPAGVEVTVDGNVVTVKGPKGQLSQEISKNMTVEVEDGTIKVLVLKRDGEWKVRMEGLPRSEKQSRD